MKVAAVQFDIAWEDKAANHATIERMIEEAAVDPGTFVVLPELGDTGFSMNLGRIVEEKPLDWACSLAQTFKVYVQHGYARCEAASGMGKNCASIIAPDGSVVSTYEKVHPFSYGKEAEHYSGGESISIGTCDDVMMCPFICYDLRFPELWRLGATQGAEVFTLGANWPSARQEHWRALIIARAIENQAYVIATNRIGNDPHLKYVGGSLIVSPRGDILAEASDSEIVLQAELNVKHLRKWREEFPALRDIRSQLIGSFPVNRSIKKKNNQPA